MMELYNNAIKFLDGIIVISAVLVLLNGKVRVWVGKRLFNKNNQQDIKIQELEEHMKILKQRMNIGEQGLKAILHDLLFTQCRRCLKKKYITFEEMENLKYIYKAYCSYNMNGTGKELYERCLKLEMKDNECNIK